MEDPFTHTQVASRKCGHFNFTIFSINLIGMKTTYVDRGIKVRKTSDPSLITCGSCLFIFNMFSSLLFIFSLFGTTCKPITIYRTTHCAIANSKNHNDSAKCGERISQISRSIAATLVKSVIFLFLILLRHEVFLFFLLSLNLFVCLLFHLRMQRIYSVTLLMMTSDKFYSN